MNRKIYTLVAAPLFFLFSAADAFSQTATPPSGSGTLGDPYLIATLDNLYWITQNSGSWGLYFKQTADIDASSSSGWDSGNGFSPIGGTGLDFTGTYDGNGHTITGLFISRSGTNYVGLFGDCSAATVKNIGLLNVNVTGYSYVGGLMGSNYHGSSVNNSYCTGSVTGAAGYLGGLVGQNDSATISSSYSTAVVSTTTGYGNYIGGFVGENYSSSTVSTSYCTGSVSCAHADYVGGFVGYNYSGSTVSNCYSTGNVSSYNEVGGFVGFNYSNSKIENCYSTGSVSSDYGADDNYIGGFVSYNLSGSSVDSCFWDTQTSGFLSSAGGTGETTAEMKTVSTFTDALWDFTIVWGISSGINNGYPYLIGVTDHPLPVQATNFLATAKLGAATLSWKTQSEVDNAGFNILRKDLPQAGQAGTTSFNLIASYASNSSLKGMGTSATGRAYNFTDENVTSGATYQYKIQSVSTNGMTKDLSTLSVTVDVPKAYALYQNYPNPFNPSTTIRFDLKEESTVTLDIYNVLGQRMLEENYGTMKAGRYNENINMERFASGVYLYRISAIGNDGQRFESIKKFMLMK
ncbi:MAG TPA: GLUG motif-containing protein [Candidatus Kryptonia bacterium]